jgi:hypothetical protein
MPPIRARTATGAEFSFPTREEFARAVAGGRITEDWEVFHLRARRWLPVTVHPAFSAASHPAGSAIDPASSPLPPATSRRQRTRELVLIYPERGPSADTHGAQEPEADPFDSGPILAPDEIQRVLFAPRRSDPHAATATAAGDATLSSLDSHQARPLFQKAMSTVPTFSKALIVAAGIVNARIP